jgi:hypothetical protein
MTMPPNSRRLLKLLGVATAIALALVGIAAAGMTSTKISPTLCETTGGGKFVAIPGFPGEMIDRRLLADIRWLRKRYPIFITDGYSMSDVHAEQGEHPIGLALDIVPDKAGGGRWSDVTRLARWAEPKQDQPRAPFRWVGYDGDEGHGRGDHLHLSWSHSETRPGFTAKLIDTIRCPDPVGGQTTPPTEPTTPPTGGSPEGTPPANGQGDRGRGHRGRGHRGHGSGGIGGKLGLAAPVVETDGVGLGE